MYSTCELVVHMLLPIAYPILWFVCLPTCSYNALVAYSQQVATLRSTTSIFQFSVLFLFKLIFLFLGFACVFNFVCSSILYCTKFARKKSSIFFPPASLFMARFRDVHEILPFPLILFCFSHYSESFVSSDVKVRQYSFLWSIPHIISTYHMGSSS